jgi:hypothetical protein
MVLAPLRKLKIKYELSYQSTTRLKYIDTFDQLLIIHQWTSTIDNTVQSSIHFTADPQNSGSTDQTPNMRLSPYSQSNDEEPYYILKNNNPFFFVLGTSIL